MPRRTPFIRRSRYRVTCPCGTMETRYTKCTVTLVVVTTILALCIVYSYVQWFAPLGPSNRGPAGHWQRVRTADRSHLTMKFSDRKHRKTIDIGVSEKIIAFSKLKTEHNVSIGVAISTTTLPIDVELYEDVDDLDSVENTNEKSLKKMDTSENGRVLGSAEVPGSESKERKLAVGSESKLAVGSESKLVVGSESKLVPGSESKESKLAVGSESKLAVGSESKESKLAVGSESKLVVGYLVPDHMIMETQHCGRYECSFTIDTTRLEDADAILVDGYLLSQTKDRIKPIRTSRNQVWIYYSTDPWISYRHTFPFTWNSIFNWTFTYDRRSDFVGSEGELVHMKSEQSYDWPRIMQLKTKKILWIADRCKSTSRREDYVRELQKYMAVDIVGRCGRKCVHSIDDNEDKLCYQQYMFYLSFEDSLCKDYVTDEFFKTFSHHIVPIVRGGTNYKNVYPSNLYINTADFPSPRLLANFLTRLVRDQTAYLGYLHRRADFVVSRRGHSQCAICSHLHHLDVHRKSYPDISQWLDNCRAPTDLHFSGK